MERNRRERNLKNESNSLDNQRRERRGKRKTYGKKGSSFFVKFLCVFIGFVIGFVGSIGGVAGLGYYAVTKVKVRDAVAALGNVGVQFEYTDYLREEYGNQTTLELIMTIADVSKELIGGSGTLNSLDQISPAVGKNVQKLIDKVSEYGIELDYEELMNTPFGQLGDFFTKNLNAIELAPMIEKLTGNKVEGLLAAICYGEEGEDYIFDENGELVFLGDASSITIGELTSADLLSSKLTGLSFHTFMSALGEINTEDAIIRTLVYGIEDEDYVLNSDGTITQLPKTYDLNTADNQFTGPDKEIFTAGEGNTWADEDGIKITLREDVTTYKYDVVDADGNLIYNLKHLETVDGVEKYQAYISDVPQVRKGFYVSDVLGGDQGSLINDIPLAAFLSISSPLATDTEPLLIMLAYGEENTHWERYIDGDGNEAWRFLKDEHGQQYSKRTIGQLTSSGDESLFNTLTIATLMNVNVNSDSIMLSLAYGNEGTHYKKVDANGDGTLDTIEMLPKKYFLGSNGKLYDAESNEVSTTLTEVATDIYQIENGSQTQYLKAAPDGGYYAYATLEDAQSESHMLYYAKTTLSDLRGSNSAKLIERIELASALNIDIFSTTGASLMVSLAYGNEDTHYELVDTDADGVKDKIEWMTNPETGLKYHARTLADLKGNNAQALINGVELASALGIDIFASGQSALMVSLAYGNEGTHYELIDTDADGVNDKIEWQTNPETGEPYHARTLGDLINNSQALIDDVEMRSLFNGSHGTIMNYLIYNVVDADPTNPDYKVRTLGDFMKDSDGIINGLTIQKMLASDIYNVKKLSSTPNAKGYYDEDASGVATLCNPVYEGNTFVGYIPVFRAESTTTIGEYSYFTYTDAYGNAVEAPLLGCWKYLLVDPSCGYERETSIDKIGGMIANVTSNMQTKSLNTLKNDGMIVLASDSTLTTKISYSVTIKMTFLGQPVEHTIFVCNPYYYEDGVTVKETLGELSVSETISYIGALIGALNGSGS